MNTAPCLVIAVGNPSRGDDGLGPALVERLCSAGVERGGEVELLTDFQLQIEHALDMQGRRAVLFVDAAWPGAAAGATLVPIDADAWPPPASHALRPQAVLHVTEQLGGHAPPAWQLAIEGQSFALGEGLSAVGEHHLETALQLALDWLKLHCEAWDALAVTDGAGPLTA
jgi:hydrogenase maturation protease